jgi:membrane protein
VLDRYGSSGGGLLAGGLAYAALFAIVPAVLLSAGLAGAFIQDPLARANVVTTVSQVLPPLSGLIAAVAAEAARDAGTVSLIGLVALVWGASRFVVSFDDALARVMGGARHRGIVASNLIAVGAVLLMMAALIAGTTLAGLAAFLDAGQAIGAVAVVGATVSLALSLLPTVAAVAAAALVYRFVPAPTPRWAAIGWPSIAVGLALTVLARAFVFAAPRLIGAAALLGTLTTAFVALAWLALSFQAVLIGAAWVRERSDRLAMAELQAPTLPA